jgi:hypothetical protein
LFVRSRALKLLNRWEEALEAVKQAIQIKTTRNLLKDLEEIEERIGTERQIIKEDIDENLEYIDEKIDKKNQDNNQSNNTISGLISLVIRYLKYISGSLWRKKKYILLVLSIILFLLFKNKIRINFIKYLSIIEK